MFLGKPKGARPKAKEGEKGGAKGSKGWGTNPIKI